MSRHVRSALRPAPDRLAEAARRPWPRSPALALALALAGLSACHGSRCDPAPAKPHAPQGPQRRPPTPGSGSPLKSPLDAQDTAGAKQRFVELLRRNLNGQIKDPAREGQWDFWSEGSTRYPLATGERAYLMSFRRTSRTSQEGFLVIGTISGQNTVVHGFWRVPAGIDDIHVIDMGKAGPMIYTVSFDTTGHHRRIYHDLLRYNGKRLSSVWSYRLSYLVDQPKTYKPITVTFRDEDKDGTREVRVRIPGSDTPRLWKRRWALFKWDAARNEFLPLRGLAFTPVATHKPLWAAFGFLEALRVHALDHARRFGAEGRSCRPVDELWETLRRREYRPVGALRRREAPGRGAPRQATMLVDLERPKDPRRYQALITLRRETSGENAWRVCVIRFFRL